MTKPTLCVCDQHGSRPACASAQSDQDQDPTCSLTNSIQVEKLIENSMDPDQIRLRGWAGWSGSVLVANSLCWFCHGMAQLFSSG
jgi:hypothetical protein